jgi:putative hydrolase of the HAD superfamily
VPANFLEGVRAVFFDAVGTLLDPDPPAAEVYSEVASRHGLDIAVAKVRERFLASYRAEEEVDRASGWVTSEVREAMRWRRIVSDSLVGVREPDACFHELFGHFARPDAWRLNPQASALLKGLLERGIDVGIGSNFDARLLAVVEGYPELASLRDRIVISARVGYRKPALEFFREVVRIAGCAPDQILFVGDEVDNDYEGALSAGLNSVLFDLHGDGTGLIRVSNLSQILE